LERLLAAQPKAVVWGQKRRHQPAFLPVPASKSGRSIDCPQAESPQETLQF